MSFDGKLDGLRVDHGALETASAGMKRTVNAIDAVLGDLVGDLKPLVDQWDGETKLAFHQCETVWQTTMTEMKDLLDKAGMTLSQSNDEFRSVDLKNAANFDF